MKEKDKGYNSNKIDNIFGWGLFIIVSVLFVGIFLFIFLNGKCSNEDAQLYMNPDGNVTTIPVGTPLN